jgi:hypothetical protein
MKINKDNAIALWEKRYGGKVNVVDFTERPIFKGDYNSRQQAKGQDGVTRNYGWNLHHILPQSLGGNDDEQNLEIVNIITNDEGEDKTSFVANDVEYQVKRIKFKPYRGIFERVSGKNVVDHNDD